MLYTSCSITYTLYFTFNALYTYVLFPMLLRAPYYVFYTTCFIFRAPYYVLHTLCFIRYNILYAASSVLQALYYKPYNTRSTLMQHSTGSRLNIYRPALIKSFIHRPYLIAVFYYKLYLNLGYNIKYIIYYLRSRILYALRAYAC